MNQRLQTQPAPAGVHRAGNAVRIAAVAIVVVAAVGVGMKLVERPPFVERITVVNSSPYELDVDTAGSGAGGWTPAGVVDPSSQATFADVVDHGDTWWVRATTGGHVATWQVPRAELERQHWQVIVPRSVSDALASDGAVRP